MDLSLSRSEIKSPLVFTRTLGVELLRLVCKGKVEAPSPLPAVSVNNRKVYFHGRETEEEMILGLLLKQESTGGDGKVQVINITGEAGTGKTALAGRIYSDTEVVMSFQLRVWVTVPRRAGVCSLVKKILEIAVADTEEDQKFSPTQSNDLQFLLNNLRLYFSRKKFLLVLDNCWIEDNSSNWDKLINSLGFTGSAIILTAAPLTSQDQAFVPPADHSVPLGLLPAKDCSSIFWGHAGMSVNVERGFDDDPDSDIIKDGWGILEKLGDLPLAAKMIGSCLLDKDADAWNRTLRDNMLNTGLDEKSQLPSFLMLSYLDLPVSLRYCLAFLSIYPKGYQFKQKQVVHLWMALGFLGEYENGRIKSMAEVGNKFFSILTRRSFLQRSCDGGSFIIHDLVHDLASYVFEVSYEKRLVLYCGSMEVFRNLLSIPDVLSTILPWGPLDEEARLLREKRVLSLCHTGITKLPSSVGELSALCYLDLSYTALRTLPNSIGNLSNLQTLLLTNCTSLTSLPDTLSNLINLLYLDIKGTGVQAMPLEMNRLTSIQTLTDFVVSRSSPRFQDLARLSNIKTLSISKLHNVVDPTEVSHAKLKEKTNLNDLTLQWGRGQDHMENESEVLENLVPPRNMKCLIVENYHGTGFPGWLGDELFQALQSVKLCHCNCISLPPLGQLPGLKHLVIEGFNKVTHVGAEFCGRTGEPFKSLESLQFQEMLAWKEWKNLEDIEFQSLCELSIICCPKLVGVLPKKLGSLKKLEKLEIYGCYEVSLPNLSSSCEVCVHDSKKRVIKVPYRRVIVPIEGKEFTPLVTDTPDTTDYSQMGTSSSEDEPSSFEMLRISNISQLENELPSKLDGLRIEECMNFVSLPVSLLLLMPTLQELYLIDCYSFKSFPPDAFPVSLRTLYVRNCPKLELFPSSKSMQKFTSLKHLSIGRSCDSLTVFALDLFPKLKALSVWDCSNLASFTISEEDQGDLASLESLEIRDCPNLKSFPIRGLPTPNMASVLLSNCKILNNVPNCRNLRSLVLHECPSLESLSLEALPSSLTSLSIAFCNKLTPHKSWGLHNLKYLSSFEIEGGYEDMESFPEKELLPSSINTLRIGGFQSLRKLDNDGFQHLKALQALEINGCDKLESLPERGLLSSLIYLCINQCQLLTQKLSGEAGEDWRPKVAHIQQIEIDGEVIC